MRTEVSKEGQIVIPISLRRRLGIKPGDRLEADIKNGDIVLSLRPEEKKPRKARIIKDPVTGLPVIDVGEDAPVLTSDMVREMLADFP
ncbi:MAG: AbrB/MazE/SpoVT family DNA-binding domain-containing protein [Acidobacteria bacterium]|nr:AbrB/MazE/SpoVT family DNA-binding domain-containing protein [Acidobacteriota bacterium]